MTFDEYQSAAHETAIYPGSIGLACGHKLTVRIRVGMIDVSAETFVGALQKVRRNRERGK